MKPEDRDNWQSMELPEPSGNGPLMGIPTGTWQMTTRATCREIAHAISREIIPGQGGELTPRDQQVLKEKVRDRVKRELSKNQRPHDLA